MFFSRDYYASGSGTGKRPYGGGSHMQDEIPLAENGSGPGENADETHIVKEV